MERRFSDGKLFLNTVMVRICADIGISRLKEQSSCGFTVYGRHLCAELLITNLRELPKVLRILLGNLPEISPDLPDSQFDLRPAICLICYTLSSIHCRGCR